MSFKVTIQTFIKQDVVVHTAGDATAAMETAKNKVREQMRKAGLPDDAEIRITPVLAKLHGADAA